MTDRTSTDFGFERIPWREKARRVRGVFDSVVGRYDLMNDLMSGGIHRLWKQFALAVANLREGQCALDVAGGTGDLSAGLAKQVGQSGLVVMTDINAAMLTRGRDRLIDAGLTGNLRYVQANAERLPFPDHCFHCVTIGFGLRNVTDKPAALASMARVLKPGGQLGILDFSEPGGLLGKLYAIYFRCVLPAIGRVVCGKDGPYNYLPTSVGNFPPPPQMLELMTGTGYKDCHWQPYTFGIAGLYTAQRA